MRKREFDSKIETMKTEVDRLMEILDNPDQILSDFFDSYKPNMIERLCKVNHISEDDLYDVLMEQLEKLPVLSNCTLTKAPKREGETNVVLHVCFREPEFSLFYIDLKAKRFENVFESVVRGFDANIRDSEHKRDKTQKNVDEIVELMRNIYQLANNDLTLRSSGFGVRGRIKRYVREVGYSAQASDNIASNPQKFIEVQCQDTLDKRQAAFASAEAEYNKHMRIKREFDSNPNLQNTIRDLRDILCNKGYVTKEVFM